MTSDIATPAFLRELSFADHREHGSRAPARFTFDHDFESPTGFPDLPFDAAASSSRYAPADRPAMHEVLDTAARAMRERVPAALSFVNGQLDRVMIRRTDRVDRANSSSNRDHVGWCVLTNLHRPADRVRIAAEALVHEAIHQCLYRVERVHGNLCDLDARRRFRSPWSGNRIPLHSLIHACFVYYGLLGFWCRFAHGADERAESADVRDRIARNLFGFAFIEAVFDEPSFPRHDVEPAVLDLIRRIAAIATGSIAAPRTGRPLNDALHASREPAWSDALATALDRIVDEPQRSSVAA